MLIEVWAVSRHPEFMSDNESKLQQEVQELKSEVRRLWRMVEFGFGLAALAIVLIYPQFLLLAGITAVSILFALLVSPVRHLIFLSIFKNLGTRQRRY